MWSSCGIRSSSDVCRVPRGPSTRYTARVGCTTDSTAHHGGLHLARSRGHAGPPALAQSLASCVLRGNHQCLELSGVIAQPPPMIGPNLTDRPTAHATQRNNMLTMIPLEIRVLRCIDLSTDACAGFRILYDEVYDIRTELNFRTA